MHNHLINPLDKSPVHLPPAHEVDLDRDYEAGDHVTTCEKYPEWNGGLRDPEHPDQDHEREDSERGVGVGVDIRVSELVYFEHGEYGDGVHERRVELEVGMVGANVVAA